MAVLTGKMVPSYKWTVLFVTTLGAFMPPLDGSIVTIAIPSIASSIKLTLEMVIWIPLAYLLFLTVLLINAGRLADLKGRKRTYIMGFVIFTAGSILCGASATGTQLILFRAIQGVGAAFIGANSAAIITDVFPAKERGKALGINGTAVYAGLMTGPLVGGILVENFGWRSIFYVNVPIGILVVTLASIKLKETSPRSEGKQFDIAGAATLSTALSSFLVALTLGGGMGWSSPPIVSMLLLSVVVFLVFLHVERRLVRHPTISISLFTENRLFAAANFTAILCYIAIIGVTFVTSIYLQDIQGFRPQDAGLFLIAMSVAMVLLAPTSGWLSDRLGSRLLSSVGMMIVTVGLLLLSQLTSSSSSQDIISRLVIVGIGLGLFSSPNTSAVMGSVERAELGVAAGTLGTMRFLGQSIGLALVGAAIATALPPREMLALFAGLSTGESAAKDAFLLGMREFFLISSVVAALGTLTSLVRGRESPSDALEAHE